jgi:hypothetical protein
MEPTTIFFIACVIVLIYLVYYSYSFNSSTLLNSATPANTKTTVKPPVSPTGAVVATSSYSIWINVNDWSVRSSYYKNIITHGTSGGVGNVYMSLTPNTNDVVVVIKNGATYTHEKIENVPLQTWVHLAVVINSRTFDLYMNGKLVKTTMLTNAFTSPPAANNEIVLGGENTDPTVSYSTLNDYCLSPTSATPATNGISCYYTDAKSNPGFSGWVARFNYFIDAQDPQSIWNLYLEGSGTNNFLSNLFGGYGLTVSLTTDGVATKSISI